MQISGIILTNMAEFYYDEIFKKLQENKVNYLVVGGIAVALHGIPRFTADADFILHLIPDNINKFIDAISELGYKPKVPINPLEFADIEKRKQWIEEKGMKVLSFWRSDRPLELIDVFVANPIDFDEMDKEKVIRKTAGLEVPIPSVRHLIKLKKIAGRPEDLRDIELLEKLHGKTE